MNRWYESLAGLALTLAVTAVLAQPYPSRPIRVVVPNAPSGLADIVSRLVSAKLAETLGQQFIVENRPGAGGTIGTAAAVRAVADGYTLLVVFDSHATNPSLFKNLEYDTLADLAPISLLVKGPMMLVVNTRLGANSVGEFVKLAKSKPGAINFATVGPGSPARLMMELFKLVAGIDVTMVPYKGAGSALSDLVGGQVDSMFATVPSVKSHLKAGRLKPLAITSEQRTPVAPGMPTMSESYPGFKTEAWVGMLAPAKTPPEIIARLNSEVVRIVNLPEMKARFADQGLESVGSTPAQFDHWVRTEIERWGKVIREQRITIE